MEHLLVLLLVMVSNPSPERIGAVVPGERRRRHHQGQGTSAPGAALQVVGVHVVVPEQQLVHGAGTVEQLVLFVMAAGVVVERRGGGGARPRRGRRRRRRSGCRLVLLAHVRSPVVLDLVVGAAGHGLGDARPPVAPLGVEVEDEALLLGAHPPALQVRVQVVHPPQTAALPRPIQTCTFLFFGGQHNTRTTRQQGAGGEQEC